MSELHFHLTEREATIALDALAHDANHSNELGRRVLLNIVGKLAAQATAQRDQARQLEPPQDPTGVDCAERYEGIAE